MPCTSRALRRSMIGPHWPMVPPWPSTSSQSRMWENLVGRSLPFWQLMYARLKRLFPSQLDGVGLQSFYRAINKVEPSFIRVNADEATYNLHIMLRLEMEIMLVEGAVSIKDLPAVWNSKMQDYLGITPKNDAEGVLQDVHWSYGSIGYFSTYALGNLVSAQIWEKVRAELPDLDDQIRAGSFEACFTGCARISIDLGASTIRRTWSNA